MPASSGAIDSMRPANAMANPATTTTRSNRPRVFNAARPSSPANSTPTSSEPLRCHATASAGEPPLVAWVALHAASSALTSTTSVRSFTTVTASEVRANTPVAFVSRSMAVTIAGLLATPMAASTAVRYQRSGAVRSESSGTKPPSAASPAPINSSTPVISETTSRATTAPVRRRKSRRISPPATSPIRLTASASISSR